MTGVEEPFESTFRGIFENEFDSLFRYLNRLTGDSAVAADIAQEAFVRLYQRGELPDDTRAWLATVSNNLVRDQYRRTRRRKELLEANANVLYDPGANPNPEEELVDRERTRRVRQVLDTLPLRHRQALLLRHQGYSYREIATAIDYRVSGVGKLIVRATQAFRMAYERVDASD